MFHCIIIRNAEPRGCLFFATKDLFLMSGDILYLLSVSKVLYFNLLTMQLTRNIDLPFRDNF